jgi:hypothetical protein
VSNELVLNAILEDLEEIYTAEGLLPLYQVGWTTSGSVDRSNPEFASLCRNVFDAFRAVHPDLVVAMVSWPIDLREAVRPAPDTPIDLDLDPAAPVDHRIPILVPPTDLA